AAALCFDRSGPTLDLLMGDALGGAETEALGPDVIPRRATQRTGAEPRSARALPLHHHRRGRRPAAGRAHPVSDGNQLLRVELGSEPGKMDLECCRDEHML